MEPLKEIEEKNNLILDINSVLSKYRIGDISLSDIVITDKTVSDLVKPNAKLSDSITDHLWPSISAKSVYHFTSREAAESILNSGIFRLSNIEKRYQDGEIRTFCESHNLQGYLETDETGNPKYRHLLMPNTYYASFTDTKLTEEQETYFYSTFSSCDGVRLKFEITASNPNFRKIYYEKHDGKKISLLSDLASCIKTKYNREFMLKGISRLCSFYLSRSDYGIENEYRTLYRAWDGVGTQPKGSGISSYIEIPLNSMSETGYQLNIVEVHAVEKPDIPNEYIFTKRKI